MRIVELENLYWDDYRIRFINCLKQFWRTKKTHLQRLPKDHSLLVYLHKCKASYKLSDGTVITGDNGSVIFIPRNATYQAVFYDLEPSEGCTFGINLHLFDAEGEELIVSEKPVVIRASGANLWELFSRINDNGVDDPPCMSLIYADLYRILARLAGGNSAHGPISGKYASIAGAIAHLRSEDAYRMKVSDMARECGVSESFLCRRFKQYSGYSPVQYIRRRRLQAAKSFLQYSDMSLDEIAYRLNYTDAAYFCKVFHRDTGITPNQYRKQFVE